MKSKLFLTIAALAVLLSIQSPALACGLSESETAPKIILQIPQNQTFIVIDRDTGDKLLCRRANPLDDMSGLVCDMMPTVKETVSPIYPLPVPRTLEPVAQNDMGDMFAKALWMLIIIGAHFVMGLVHTWYRERKKK